MNGHATAVHGYRAAMSPSDTQMWHAN
jgi:hypothetical protein